MSFASDALLKATVAKTAQLEKMLEALKLKVDALESITIPRPTLGLRNKQSQQSQQSV